MQQQFEWLKQKLQQQSWQDNLLQDLHYHDFESLYQEIVRVRVKAQQATGYAIIQAQPQVENFALVFSPIILSLMGHTAIFYAPAASSATQVLQQYFNLDALAQAHDQALQDMQLCFDVQQKIENQAYFELLASVKALLNPHVSHVILIDPISIELSAWMSTFGCQSYHIQSLQSVGKFTDIDYKTLFWKRKSPENIKCCQHITHSISQLLNHLNLMKAHDLERLIDDFMYSEHLFEKISVFGEFTETIYKDHLLKSKKA